MAGIEKIKSEIIASAEMRANKIIEEAQSQAKEIIDNAVKEAENKKEQIAANAESKVAIIKSSADSACALDKKNKILGAKTELINKAFLVAEEKLCSLSAQDYFSCLKKLIVHYSVSGEGTLVLSETDKARIPNGFLDSVNKDLGTEKSIKISEETDNSIKGGFIIKYDEIDINCTFSAIIAGERERLVDKVNKCLFN